MRFLQLSDIHFNEKSDGWSTRKLREELIPYLKGLNFSVDDLLITGDFRDARSKSDTSVTSVVEYIKEIAAAVQIEDVRHIHLIPGNHDRARKDGDIKRIEKIRQKYNAEHGRFPEDDLAYMLEQFDDFNLVCEELYGAESYRNFISSTNPHAYRFIDDTVFLYLNTALTHSCSDDRHRLLIGSDYVDLLLREIDKKYPQYPIVVLAHHSPDFFENAEKQAIESIFRDHPMVKFYLCGDAHDTWVRKVNNHLEITAGCLRNAENTEKSFICGNTDLPKFEAHHWVKSWEPFAYYNTEFDRYFPPHTCLSDNEIKQDQMRIRRDVLLPWMRNSPGLDALFPGLFIEPLYCSEKRRIKYNSYHDILKNYRDLHIIITGEAGAGKTTLLRQIYLYENTENSFLYLHAKALIEEYGTLSSYQKFVRNLLLGDIEVPKDYTILLDGIDEAYPDNTDKLNRLIDLINKSEKVHVWFGWRKEHYAQNETPRLRQMVSDVILLSAWDASMARNYVNKYATAINEPFIIQKYDELIWQNPTIEGFTESPFQLTLLTYLIENEKRDSAISDFLSKPDKTLYQLYNSFFKCWKKKEAERKTSTLSTSEIKEALWRISTVLYYAPSCEISDRDSAIVDLLTFSSLGIESHIATGFFHRSFCAFFLADKVVNSVSSGNLELLIESFSIPLKNDVTDFVRSAISDSSPSEITAIQNNLIAAYHQLDSPIERTIDPDIQYRIRSLSDKEKFVIKNELIYLVTRIPDPTNRIPAFLEEIHKANTDPYILLDIAYAATLTGPTKIALDYAKSLIPGSENDLVNRSWTLAYFGDVQANPHEYQDTHKVPWAKSRAARLRRFQQSGKKALRFRILDLPLLYCYYSNREWHDACKADYDIIANVDVENSIFSEEEKQFLRQQREKLLRGFETYFRGSYGQISK